MEIKRMNEDFRKLPPESLEPIPFNLPTPVRFELANGLKVVVVKDGRFPTINMRLGIRFGDIDDPPNGIGINSAMASLMTEGTRDYSSRELAEKIDSLGGGLSVGAGFDNTVLRLSSLSTHFREMCGLAAEVLMRPVFPEKELELYKQNAIEGLKYQRSQPDFLSDEKMASIIYGDHPYSVNSPKEADFAKLARAELVSAWEAGMIPNNAVLVAVGDIEPSELEDILNQEFGEWIPGNVPDRNFPEPPARDHRTLTIVDRPGSTQSNIVLSNLAIKRLNEDYFPFLLMNQVLGAGASSRLFMNLREEKGYTYGAYSRIYARRHAGSFEATSEVRSAVTGDSLKEFFFELKRIREEKVSDQELEDAKNFLAGVFPIRAETQGGLIGLIMSQQLQSLPDDYLETYRDKVRSVTPDEIQRAARSYVHPENLAIVIVGDASEVLGQAKGFAEQIEIFDAAGGALNPSDCEQDEDAETADISGKWSVVVDAQGQELPVSFSLEQVEESFSGEMSSMLGNGKIESGLVKGKSFSAEVVSEFQGAEITMSFKGVSSGATISGSITIPIMPDPLSFKGTRD